MASVSWPAGAIDGDTDVQLDASVPGVTLPGYGTGGYGVELSTSSFTTLKRVRSFAAPLTLRFAPRSGRLAPVYSTNGTVWKHVPQLVGRRDRPGRANRLHARGRSRLRDPDDGRPAGSRSSPTGSGPRRRADVSGRFLQGSLTLSWSPSIDRNGPIAGYRVTLTNDTIWELPRRTHHQRVGGFHLHGPSVYRVVAVDAAGNESRPSKPVVVLPSKRPRKVPKAIPAWAWELLRWKSDGSTPRPKRAEARARVVLALGEMAGAAVPPFAARPDVVGPRGRPAETDMPRSPLSVGAAARTPPMKGRGRTHRPLNPTIPANLSRVCNGSVPISHQSPNGRPGYPSSSSSAP